MELLAALTPFAFLAALAYLATCLVWPYKNCRACRGTGRITALLGRAVRICPPCAGQGLELRPGRRAITRAQRAYRHYRRNRNNKRPQP